MYKNIFLILISIFFVSEDIFAQLPQCPSSGLVTGCCEITEGSKTYTLQNDVWADETCFQIRAGNIIFDLNGKTVNYAQDLSKECFYIGGGDYISICNAFNSSNGADNVTITNGNIAGASNEYSHGIYFMGGSDNININNLNLTVSGLQTEGIIVEGGNYLTINNVKIAMDSSKKGCTPCTSECSHGGGHIRGIGITHRGGKIEIHDNEITGKGMGGINVTTCERWGDGTPGDANDDEPMKIYANYISMESPINDGYAIAVGANDNKCSDGTVIFNNIMDQINGRGIMIGGMNYNGDHGPGNIEAYNNSIFVQEGSDCENHGYGNAIGFRVRFGAHDVYAHDNYISGIGGPEAGVDHYDGADGGSVTGIFLSSGKPYGVNNIFERNLVETSTSNSSMYSIALEVGGGNPTDKTPQSYFRKNTFKSNRWPVRISNGGDAQGYNVSFDEDNLVKGENPFNFESLALGGYWWGITGIDLIGMSGENGADPHDIRFYTCTGDCDGYTQAPIDDIELSWKLNVDVVDNAGNPLTAFVQIFSGSNLMAEGEALNGKFNTIVPEKRWSWISNSINETDFNTFSIKVNYAGIIKEINNISITENHNELIRYTEITGDDTTPPVVTNSSPSGTIPTTTETIIEVTTNESATCKFSETLKDYDLMENVFQTDLAKTNHVAQVLDLTAGSNKYYYVRCMDIAGNKNLDLDYYLLSFWVAYDRSSDIIDNNYQDPVDGEKGSPISDNPLWEGLKVSGGCGLVNSAKSLQNNYSISFLLLAFCSLIMILASFVRIEKS